MRYVGILFAVVFAAPVSAGLLDDVVQIVTAPITAPIEATRRVLEGDDPTTVIRDPIQAGGRVLGETVDLAQLVHNTIESAPREAIRRNLGGDWDRAYDLLTASQRVSVEMGFTGGRYLSGCLVGQRCDLDQLVAMPLAAAMRDAYKVYSGYARPVGSEFAQALSVVVPPHVAHGARFTVGVVPDFTIPGFLNAANALAGSDHAVTLANVIVFSRTPDPLNSCSDLEWVLHELRHVDQYSQYASHPLEMIDGFAVDYVTEYEDIEADAREVAAEWLTDLGDYYGFTCY